MDWNFRDISSNYCPRQFEYHPSKNGLIFGTVSGEICAVDTTIAASTASPHATQHIKSLGFYGKNKNDTMLGICWMRPQPYYDNHSSEGFYSSTSNNSNLFVCGSSHGRVVMGDASKAYDPDNRDKYSIVHDYPEFDRLTSVHLNSTNKLLLLSGYSTGVNIVDLETAKSVRTYSNIHRDHVNISRFSYLSPHLFATSSFDSTIKTWDLRQSNTASGVVDGTVVSTGKPIYTVKCNSGVVMINFSSDDNFILASALDNEINQYTFLDGRKHLTYNLPKTGLKGNFTRAYYSASGRHTLTGACEESTVKIMCSYTGEMLSHIELYPGKKDKSLYIQSLRGCPIDDEQLCVLTNYRDLQTRELVMVSRNPVAVPLRSIAADASLPAVTHEELPPPRPTADPSRSIADWFATTSPPAEKSALPEELSVWDFFMEDDDVSTEARRLHLDTAAVEAERFLQQHSRANDAHMEETEPMDREEGSKEEVGESEEGATGEQEFALLTNNAFMHYYSSQYVEEMRSLGRFCNSLIHTFTTSAEGDASMHLALTTLLNISLDSGGAKYRSDVEDLVLLVHTAQTAEKTENALLLLPVHGYILKARCPALYEYCSRQPSSHSNITASLRSSEDEFGMAIPIPTADISNVGDFKDSSGGKNGIPAPLLFLLPLLIDYLYTGNKAFDLTVLRFYCLQQFLHDSSVERTDFALISTFLPHVGEVLRAEILEYLALKGGEKSTKDESVKDEFALEPYCTARAFFTLQGKEEIELLVKISVDDHCWRQSSVLSGAIVRVLQQLLELAQIVQLPAVRDITSCLLEQSMCPNNAVDVFDTAVLFDCPSLRSACLQYISSHKDVLTTQIEAYRAPLENEGDNKILGKRNSSSNATAPVTNALIEALQALSSERSVEVVSRSEFRARKLQMAKRAKAAARRPDGKPLSIQPGVGELSPVRSRHSEDNLLWLMEESPFIPGNEAIPASICLSRYISTTASQMFDHSMIFLGGQNLDRLHSLSNRILTYNYVKNEYKYVTCGGTYVPKCGYMVCTGALQKYNPTHLLAMGGKLKKMEVSVKHTTLPQHLQTLSVQLGATLGPNTTRRGINVTPSGPTSLVHNRLIDVWNLNADREELSPPTAAAAAAEMQSTLDSLRVAEEQGTQSIALAHDMSKSMGVIFELDYRTLTWRSPCVKYVTTTSLSSYTRHSTAQALQLENETELLRRALNQRIGQTMACLYHEDVQYRCDECLFSTHPSVICNCYRTRATKPKAVGTTWMLQFAGYCSKTEMIMNDLHVLTGKPKKTTSADPRDVEYEYSWSRTVPSGEAPQGRFSHASAVVPYVPNSTTLPESPEHLLHAYTRMIIFGGVGYDDDMMSTVVSLRINNSSPPANSTNRSKVSSEFSHYSHWEEVIQDGPSPSARQGHTLMHLPDTNMLVLYGGSKTGGPGQRNACCTDMWILRLLSADLLQESSGFTALNVTWSSLTVDGVPPSLRSRHTAFTVPKQSSHTYSASQTDLQGVMFVFGGVDEGKLQQRQARGDEGKIDFDEEQKDSIMHAMHVTSTVTKVRRRLALLSTTVENTVVTTGTWLAAASPFARVTAKNSCLLGRFLYFVSEISVPMPACSLTKDMLRLLDPIFSTALTSFNGKSQAMDRADDEINDEEETLAQEQLARLQKIAKDFFAHRGVTPPAGPIDDSSALVPRLKIDVIDSTDQTTNFAVYYSLLCRRCDWFNILLTSEMKGSGSEVTELFGTDPVAFRLLLMFIYADALMICSMQDVVAVLELANQYDLTLLAKKCEGVLVRLISLENLCELLDYSDTLNLDTLRTACTAVFLRDVIGVQWNAGLLSEFFPDQDVSKLDIPRAATDIVQSDSHRATMVSKDASLRAELVSAFTQLSPELRADMWQRITLSVQVFAGAKVSTAVIATNVSTSG